MRRRVPQRSSPMKMIECGLCERFSYANSRSVRLWPGLLPACPWHRNVEHTRIKEIVSQTCISLRTFA